MNLVIGIMNCFGLILIFFVFVLLFVLILISKFLGFVGLLCLVFDNKCGGIEVIILIIGLLGVIICICCVCKICGF